MKKLLNKITNNEELLKVYNNNEKLKTEVYNNWADDMMFWADNYLQIINDSLSNYSYSIYGMINNFITVKDEVLFVESCKKLQNDYCFFDDNMSKYLELISQKQSELYFMEYDNKNYEQLKEWLVIKVEHIAKSFITNLNKNFKCTSLDLEDYFINNFIDNASNDYYINDNYELFKHIEYEETYQ